MSYHNLRPGIIEKQFALVINKGLSDFRKSYKVQVQKQKQARNNLLKMRTFKSKIKEVATPSYKYENPFQELNRMKARRPSQLHNEDIFSSKDLLRNRSASIKKKEVNKLPFFEKSRKKLKDNIKMVRVRSGPEIRSRGKPR